MHYDNKIIIILLLLLLEHNSGPGGQVVSMLDCGPTGHRFKSASCQKTDHDPIN